ncbi:MAG: hypothetical protein JO170_18995 [Verrucomicrobia bacterium]|nr:hypothetical protein [Verrucomicrobiota bacterium]
MRHEIYKQHLKNTSTLANETGCSINEWGNDFVARTNVLRRIGGSRSNSAEKGPGALVGPVLVALGLASNLTVDLNCLLYHPL